MPSPQARLIVAATRLLRTKRMFDGVDRVHRSIARDRTSGPAEPPAGLRKRYTVGEREFAGHRVHTVGPKDRTAHHHILFLHGGGWVMSITEPHWELVAALVERLGCAVTVPLYPRPPEHSATDTFAMLRPLYAELVAQADPAHLTVLGDSSGANLALSLAMQVRDLGLPQPARLALISPAPDATFSNPAMPALDRVDPILSLRGLPELGRLQAGDLDVHDPVVSPLFGSLKDLAPIAVFTGTRDILNADAHRLKDKAAREGAALAWFEYPDMLHAWLLFPMPEATRAVDQLAEFVSPTHPN